MKQIIFLILLLCGGTASHCSGQTASQLRAQVAEVTANMRTLQCDFVQTKHVKMLNENMVSRGRMFYMRNDRLRWEYNTPYAYTFILNGDKVLLNNGNTKRNDVIDVNKNKFFKEISRIMVSSVVGSCLTDDKTFKTTVTTSGAEWIATLVPVRKDIKQMFDIIILHFDKKRKVVTKIEMTERNGDKTTIVLQNIRTNENISANMFTVH